MGCKFCVVIRIDSMATEENLIHVGIALWLCFIVFSWEAFDFDINVEFLFKLLR